MASWDYCGSHVQFVIDALKLHAEELGIDGKKKEAHD